MEMSRELKTSFPQRVRSWNESREEGRKEEDNGVEEEVDASQNSQRASPSSLAKLT